MAPERKFDHEEARRLRASGDYTVDALAEHFGVTKGAITQATKMVAPQDMVKSRSRTPETAEEMLERAIPELWRQFEKTNGIAKMKAFDAIVAAAKRERADGEGVKEPEPFIADVVSGVASLSVERRREILTAEQARCRVELAKIDGVLAVMANEPITMEV